MVKSTLPRPPILLVEDTISLQIVYRSVLTSAGYAVTVASSATEALARFKTLKPAVVLLDLVLPDRDGLELMQELLAARPETGLIAITANGSVNRAVQAMRAGAHDFLVKPVDENRLLDAVRNVLATRRLRASQLPVPAPDGSTGSDMSGLHVDSGVTWERGC